LTERQFVEKEMYTVDIICTLRNYASEEIIMATLVLLHCVDGKRIMDCHLLPSEMIKKWYFACINMRTAHIRKLKQIYRKKCNTKMYTISYYSTTSRLVGCIPAGHNRKIEQSKRVRGSIEITS